VLSFVFSVKTTKQIGTNDGSLGQAASINTALPLVSMTFPLELFIVQFYVAKQTKRIPLKLVRYST